MLRFFCCCNRWSSDLLYSVAFCRINQQQNSYFHISLCHSSEDIKPQRCAETVTVKEERRHDVKNNLSCSTVLVESEFSPALLFLCSQYSQFRFWWSFRLQNPVFLVQIDADIWCLCFSLIHFDICIWHMQNMFCSYSEIE